MTVSLDQSPSADCWFPKVPSSQDLINWWLKEEQILESAEIRCEKWWVPRDFSESKTLQETPEELILYIIRTGQDQGTDIKEFKAVKDKRKIEIDHNIIWAKSKYNLYAFVNHKGESSEGHYTAEVKDKDGDWYFWNDDEVTKINDRVTSTSESAYILFYKKKLKMNKLKKDKENSKILSFDLFNKVYNLLLRFKIEYWKYFNT